MILVFGILGLVCCQLFGVAAWVMGSADLEAMDRGELDPSGRDLTNIGKFCGIASVALLVLGLAAYSVIFALTGSAWFLSS